MRQARTIAAVRTKRGVQGRSRRRAVASPAVGADPTQALSAGGSVEPDAIDQSLGASGLAPGGETSAAARYGRLRLKAEAALELLITAKGVPANVRASAVRTALELVGAIGVRSKDQRDQEDADGALDPERLSIEDIDREIGKLGRV